MEEAIRSQLIQTIEMDLANCESEISALAREALNPKTSGRRRAEALILRAEMQTRSVSLSRHLKRLYSESDGLACVHKAEHRQNGGGCSESGRRCKWLWTNTLFRAS